MRIEFSELNPLISFFQLIPETGLQLSRDNLEKIGNLLKTGGIIAETYKEVIGLLIQFEEWYGMITIKDEDGKYFLRKTNGENAQ